MADGFPDPARDDSVFLAALAGLLHDIGKFAQRAGAEPDAASQAFGPEDYGAHGAHAKWSIAFIHECVPQRWWSGLAPVLYHHRPQDRLSKIVALADRLSAAEREAADQAGPKQLVPIFYQVGDAPPRDPLVWPLAPRQLREEAIFPAAPLGVGEEKQAYSRLWNSFTEEARALAVDDLSCYVESLLRALQRHAWCVPGAFYRSVPDVSLYDHSRTAAAIAACLSGLDEETVDTLLAGAGDNVPIALLVGGDISGVQDFIYTITARGAARGLRGRSFYLQLLTEAVARFILRELRLPITNLLYAGGGHFYLLAPAGAAKALERLRSDISDRLLTHHGGDLYLAIGWARATAPDFEGKRFGSRWREVAQEMGAAKRQRFAEIDDAEELVARVFGPVGSGGEEKGECQVCHYDGDVRVENEGRDDERRICTLCQSLEQLGSALRDAGYMLLGEVEPVVERRSGYQEALRAFGMAAGLVTADGRPLVHLDDQVERAALLAMRDVSNVVEVAGRLGSRRGYPVAAGTHYTVNVAPHTAEGTIATFDSLQAAARGVRRLGVLRMDVDDLGEIFRQGLRDATLSRVAALSSALSLFFEGWVGELMRREDESTPGPAGQRLYAIYSGGDDLFVVGSWDLLPGLAYRIRQDLELFAAHNPAFTISAGLTLHAGKYPLYQAAEDAAGALDAAKDLERESDHNKDAFNFLGLTIPWEEFGTIQREAETLVGLTDAAGPGGAGAARSLLRVLLRLYAAFTQAARAGEKVYWGPWMWHSAYYLTRAEERARGGTKDEIGRLREMLADSNFGDIDVLGPAARWAELLTRREAAA